jgi:Zn-finger nucleic acid-binding protein
MECPRDLVEMKDVVGRDDSTLSTCDSCGGVWIDSADLNRLLLHSNLPGLESMGGKANLDELAERCPKDQVDLVVIEGGDKSDVQAYAYCEACGGIWLDLQVAEGADADEIEATIVEFFKKFRRSGVQTRSVRP